MKLPIHGANPRYLYESFGMAMPDKTVDFSMNVNPFGMPQIIKDNWLSWLDVISYYPDPKTVALKVRLANREKIDLSSIIVGNGGAELIFLIGTLFRNKSAVIVQPAFSEYEEACRVNDCKVFYHKLPENDWTLSAKKLIKTIEETNSEVVFLCTPNNPTGLMYDQAQLKKLVKYCSDKKITVVIDEAFYDFATTENRNTALVKQYSNVIIIRSLTKMYAIAGLRLGYVIANEEIITKLETVKPHWSVNGIAIEAGLACLDEETFVRKTVSEVQSERKRLFQFFDEHNYSYSNSAVNFYLLRDNLCDEQLPLFKFLLKRGIIPRHTNNFPGLDGNWLRFAVKLPSENDHLMEALKQWRADN